MKLLIINGPNLNLLGTRETEIYGSETFEEYLLQLQAEFPSITIHYFQSNHEGEIIDKLHEANHQYEGIVINAGAYSHTSIAIADALRAIETPAVEVHISNVYQREAFRQMSHLSSACEGCIVGLGMRGYELAIRYLV